MYVLEIDGDIKGWLADRISSYDRRVLSMGQTASSKDQQAAEALAILVALREWAPQWRDKRIRLQLRTDNVAALATLIKLQPHSNSLGIIARELVLDVALSTHCPDEAVHIPGLANKAADTLSRLYQPDASTPLAPYLTADLQHKCAERLPQWWRALPR